MMANMTAIFGDSRANAENVAEVMKRWSSIQRDGWTDHLGASPPIPDLSGATAHERRVLRAAHLRAYRYFSIYVTGTGAVVSMKSAEPTTISDFQLVWRGTQPDRQPAYYVDDEDRETAWREFLDGLTPEVRQCAMTNEILWKRFFMAMVS